MALTDQNQGIDLSVRMAAMIDADGEVGIPLTVTRAIPGTSSTTAVVSSMPFPCKVVGFKVINTAAGASATTFTLQNGTDAITDAVDVYDSGTKDTYIHSASTIDDAHYALDTGDTLNVAVSDTTTSTAGIAIVDLLATDLY